MRKLCGSYAEMMVLGQGEFRIWFGGPPASPAMSHRQEEQSLAPSQGIDLWSSQGWFSVDLLQFSIDCVSGKSHFAVEENRRNISLESI